MTSLIERSIRKVVTKGISALAERNRNAMKSDAPNPYLRGIHEPMNEELTLTVSRVALEDAVSRALSGSITNAAAVAGILAAWTARARGWRDLRPAGAPWPARPGR